MARTADTAMYEAMSLQQKKTDEIVAANTKAIADLTAAIKEQSKTVANQDATLSRLERAVSNLVTGISEQKVGIDRMVNQQSEFLRLATRQADIIGNLTKGVG